ncbi:exosome nuclease subunit [Lunasporangiospora selenospora]|uniref:Exosome nuclease subunit n=1 Tax=Lunasporangiospora selenospora TaxID=979761 RepID=A0A9P6FTR3_9FUNG|nr:exosome nuclease subunit [Lunasporangiospora selenospora]
MATNQILSDFEGWQKSLFSTLVRASKAANAIPADDVSFYRSLDQSFAANMDDVASASLDMCNGLLYQAGGSAVQRLNDKDDVKDRFDVIVDVVDNLLEKVVPILTKDLLLVTDTLLQDVSIDELKGTRKKPNTTIAQSAPVVVKAKSDKLEYRLIHAQHIARPQIRFPDPVDNSSTTFVRKITVKPNAKVPLDYGMERLKINDGDSNEETTPSMPHPYEYEIAHLEYPGHMFEQRPEQLYHPFDSTSAIWVDTEEVLVDMCRTLEMQREIAIDLEHHNYRSYQGFVCLMQISTRDQDYVVDTLELRGSLHLLNQSFTDPNIVKILHGADSDIIWLQRDFGVYIVNMFDTYHASKVLEFGSHSLAYLLKYYADFDADKRYQLADWRIRPLPKEMFSYARSDTHFLLYVYDRMRNSLLDRSNPNTHNLLHATLQRSAETALKRHEKEGYDAEEGEGPNGWRNMYSKWNRSLNTQQFAVFKALHAWRDQIAREEDESLRYVLPNHMLFTLAEKMPNEGAAVLACCNPVPPPVKMNAGDIALLISRTMLSVGLPTTGAGYKLVEMDVPSHIRFDPATGLQVTEAGKKANAAAEGSRLAVAGAGTASGVLSHSIGVRAATGSGLFGRGSVSRPVIDTTRLEKDANQLMAKRSNVFGALTTLKVSTPEEEAFEKAKRIMEELSKQHAAAETPRFKEITNQEASTPASESNPATPVEEMVFVPKEERETKQKRTDVLVLSDMSKKRSRAMDEDAAQDDDMEGSDTGAEETEEGSTVANNGEDSTGPKKRRKGKKGKKGQLLEAGGEVSSSAVSSAAASGDEQGVDKMAEAFKPFDYNSVRSVVDEAMDSGSKKKKNRKKNANANANASANGSSAPSPAPFDPYTKLLEDSEFKKKDASLSRNPKSGSRSMTFKQ